MKIKAILYSICIPLAAALSIQTASATYVFYEDFDGAPYSNNTFVPTGLNQINYGEWVSSGSAYRQGVASVNNYLSPNRSMALTRTASFPNGSRAIGRFGYSNQAAESITSALTLRMAFNMTDYLSGFYIAVRSSDDRTRAFVELSANNELQASFGGVRSVLAAIEKNTWYYVEFLLPAEPSNTSTYTANLYASDGVTLLGSQTGVMAQTGASNYNYFVAYHTMQDQTLYLDNISATVIPEANTTIWAAAMLTVAMAYGVGRRFMRK